MKLPKGILFFAGAALCSWAPGFGAAGEIGGTRADSISEVLQALQEKVSVEPAASAIGDDQASSLSIEPRLTAHPAVVNLPQTLKGISPTHNNLRNYLVNHAGHAQMQGLLQDPKMEKIPVDLAALLRAEGVQLTSERDGMLPQADKLDADDTRLAAESKELEASKRDLDARKADLESQVAYHNSQCNPYPPERREWCLQNATRLNGLINVYNADVRAHNTRLEDWKSRAASHSSAWEVFVAQIRAWEARVNALIEKIKRAFDGVLEPPGDCTTDEHRTLQDDVKAKCDIERKCISSQPCDVLRINLGKNNACVIARLTINNQCFRGGDRDHQEAYGDAVLAADRCSDIIAKQCGGVGVITPARFSPGE